MFENVLKNPTLEGHKIDRELPKGGYVELPDDWQYDTLEAENDNTIPQLLHRDNAGYVLSWGWMKFRVGLRQRVNLQRGQRYLCKAVVDFHLAKTNPGYNDTDIEIRFALHNTDGTVLLESNWENAGEKHKVALFVFESLDDGVVNFVLEVRSRYPSHTCDLQIHSLELQKVGSAYGTAVQYVEPLDDNQKPVTTPTPDPLPTPTPDPLPTPGYAGGFTAAEALLFAHSALLASEAAAAESAAWRAYAARLQQSEHADG